MDSDPSSSKVLVSRLGMRKPLRKINECGDQILTHELLTHFLLLTMFFLQSLSFINGAPSIIRRTDSLIEMSRFLRCEASSIVHSV